MIAIALMAPTAQGGAIVLDQAVMQELNLTLDKYLDLHASMARGLSDEQIEIGIRDVILELELTRELLSRGRTPAHERGHIGRLIDAAHIHFEQAESAFGFQRQARLEDAINDLVNFVRIFSVHSKFLIYFCERDKKSWVQLSGRAQNPFGSDEMRNCGIKAN